MRVAFVSPEVGRQGATQACTAEIIERVSREHDVTVYARQVGSRATVSRARIVRVPSMGPPLPALLRYLTFLLVSNLMLAWHQYIGGRRYQIVHATGGDCFLADVLTAHYCQAERLALATSARMSVEGKGRLAPLDVLSQWAYMPIVSAIERLMYGRGRVRAIIAVSDGVGRDIVRHYGARAPIATIPNGVDLQRFHPRNRAHWRKKTRAELGLRPETFVLCFVGGDWGRKGLRIAIEALCHLTAEQVALVVLGRGDEAQYHHVAERHGVAQRVYFMGQTSGIEQYLAATDAFLLPSAYEAFSVAILEAAAAGLPLLVTHINGTDELVSDGVNGFFVDRQPLDVAEKVRALVHDRDLAARMGRAARTTVEKRCDWKAVAKRTLAVYERVARNVT